MNTRTWVLLGAVAGFLAVGTAEFFYGLQLAAWEEAIFTTLCSIAAGLIGPTLPLNREDHAVSPPKAMT